MAMQNSLPTSTRIDGDDPILVEHRAQLLPHSRREHVAMPAHALRRRICTTLGTAALAGGTLLASDAPAQAADSAATTGPSAFDIDRRSSVPAMSRAGHVPVHIIGGRPLARAIALRADRPVASDTAAHPPAPTWVMSPGKPRGPPLDGTARTANHCPAFTGCR